MDIVLIWLALAVINLLGFLYIDKDIVPGGWDNQIWLITLVCCILPPLGWLMFAIILWLYNSGNKQNATNYKRKEKF